MRVLAVAILLSYLQVAAHQIGHADAAHGNGRAVQTHAACFNPFLPDSLCGESAADAADDDAEHGAQDHCGASGDLADADHRNEPGHEHFVHAHASLLSLSPRTQAAAVPSPPVLLPARLALDCSLRSADTNAHARTNFPSSHSALSQNVILRI